MTYIRWFDEVGAADVGLVGGKGANLGEMAVAGLPVPPGFCLAAGAYRDFIQAVGLDETIRSIVAETRQDDPADVEANKSRPWPDIIRGSKEIYAEDGVPAEAAAGQLGGVAGSPGVVTGIARVIRGPEEFEKLRNGDILVAPLTTPVWTPLFAMAGGVITEVGGILSHGAIVAREYGIPAVMSIAGATKRVREGQTVTVNGNRGVVYLEPERAAC